MLDTRGRGTGERYLIPIRELKDNLEMREMRHRGNVVRMISENIERRTEFVSE